MSEASGLAEARRGKAPFLGEGTQDRSIFTHPSEDGSVKCDAEYNRSSLPGGVDQEESTPIYDELTAAILGSESDEPTRNAGVVTTT
ncbi:hypothetical protein ACFQ68_11915 [Amycolatopsis japonica]|uniref:hypothetical protein n=1 Tax=Amycolatopsis japonica TaxID=208439 RepID=UPI00366C9A21